MTFYWLRASFLPMAKAWISKADMLANSSSSLPSTNEWYISCMTWICGCEPSSLMVPADQQSGISKSWPIILNFMESTLYGNTAMMLFVAAYSMMPDLLSSVSFHQAAPERQPWKKNRDLQ